MKNVALVSLDCVDGTVKRYWRNAGNKPVETGRSRFDDWQTLKDDPFVDWLNVSAWLQAFRAAWTPPEDPAPRPTTPLRTAIAA